MYFLIPFLKVDGEHKWVPPRLCESTQLALGIKKREANTVSCFITTIK